MPIQVNSSGILFPDGTLQTIAAYDISVAQSWQNVTGSRALNVTYTNNYTPNRPIFISVITGNYNTSRTSTEQQMEVNGVVVGVSGFSNTTGQIGVVFNTITAFVPYGATYKVVVINGGSLDSWFELK